MAAKRFGDGSDDADFGFAIGKAPAFGGFGFVLGFDGKKRKALLDAGQNFFAGHDQFFEPDAAGIERHEFDESHGQAAAAAKFGERFDFVIVDAPNDDGVDLDGREAEFLREFDAYQNFAEAIASGDAFEVVSIERIKAEADAAKAGVAEGFSFFRKQKAVGRDGEIVDGINAAESSNEQFEFLAQKRFSASEPDFLDAQINGDRDDALDFFE